MILKTKKPKLFWSLLIISPHCKSEIQHGSRESSPKVLNILCEFNYLEGLLLVKNSTGTTLTKHATFFFYIWCLEQIIFLLLLVWRCFFLAISCLYISSCLEPFYHWPKSQMYTCDESASGGSGKGPPTPVKKCQTTLQATRAECGSDWLHSSWLAVGDAHPSQHHIFYLPNVKTLSVTCATSHRASLGV